LLKLQKYIIKIKRELGAVMHTYNPRTQGADTGGLQIGGQLGLQLAPGLHTQILSQKNKTKQNQKGSRLKLLLKTVLMVPK
jgi:hypothetical protein